MFLFMVLRYSEACSHILKFILLVDEISFSPFSRSSVIIEVKVLHNDNEGNSSPL